MSVGTRVQIRSNKELKVQVTDLNRMVLVFRNRYRSSPDNGYSRDQATTCIEARKAVRLYFRIPIRRRLPDRICRRP